MKTSAAPDPEEASARATRVFISYSRKDSTFAEGLRDALITRGFEAYLDIHDIRPGEPWQERLSGLITRADIVVFCLSPNFVLSEICDWEVNEAERIGKQLLPVVLADPDPEAIPGRLKRLNYIFMRDEAEHAGGIEKLQSAINTDIDWIQDHTRLTERAAEWLAAGKRDKTLLRGDDIAAAEKWITERPSEAPNITEDIAAYIAESRQAETAREKRARRRGRIITGASLAAAAIFAWLGWLMYGQWQDGLYRESLALSDVAQLAIREGDAVTAQLLALEAQHDPRSTTLTQKLRPWVPQALTALDAANRRGVWQDKVFVGHTGNILSVAFSPDGKTFLTGSADKTAKLWDVATGKVIRSFTGHGAGVKQVAFSPDGETILTLSLDKTMRLWKATTGEVLHTMSGHDRAETVVAFSPQGDRLVSASWDKTAKIWDVATGKELKTLQDLDDLVETVAFSPDGRSISTAARFKIRTLDLQTGKKVRTASLDYLNLSSVMTFSPDGRTFLSGALDDNVLRLWDSATGKKIKTFSGHTDDVYAMAFAPDGKTVATCSYDNTVKFWDVATSRELRSLRLWDGEPGKELSATTKILRTSKRVSAVAFAPDGKTIVTSSLDNTARLWDVATGKEIRTYEGPGDYVLGVAIAPDGKSMVTSLVHSAVKIWDTDTGEVVTTLEGEKGIGEALAFSPDGKSILVGSPDTTFKLWDTASGTKIKVFTGHEKEIYDVAFAPDGKTVLSGSGDKTARLWDAKTGEVIKKFEGHADSVGAVAFAPDGKTILTGSWDNTARTWDVATGKTLKIFKGHTDGLSSVAIAPDGKTIVTASFDHTAKLWDTATGKSLRDLTGHKRIVNSVTFGPRGKTVITVSLDNTARQWDVATGEELRVFTGHYASLYGVAITPDGRNLLTGGEDRKVRLWELVPREQALERAKSRAPRCLTRSQRARYYLPPTPPRWCFERKVWPYHDPEKTPPPPYSWGERAAQVYDVVAKPINQLAALFDDR